MFKDLISKIEDASVVIPNKFTNVKDGTAYNYAQGLLAGRKQAIKIIKEYFTQSESKQ